MVDVQPDLTERERRRAVHLGCQVEPVFARYCYTRLFRASIENPKKKKLLNEEHGKKSVKKLNSFPGRLGYFPIASLYREWKDFYPSETDP